MLKFAGPASVVVHAGVGALGLVVSRALPLLSTATQVSGTPTQDTAFRALPLSITCEDQVGVAAVGLAEISALPASSTAVHSTAVGEVGTHETLFRWCPLSVSVLVHTGEPAVGFVQG